MARAVGQKDYINMAGGLITEASPLSFPEGFTSGELNFTINKENGLRERRKGFEHVYETLSDFAGTDSELENLHYWRGSGYVVAVVSNDTPETYLRLHRFGDDFTDFADIQISDSKVRTQIAELTNYLVVTLNDQSKPLLLVYDEVSQEITVNEVNLFVRDFELVDDGLSVSENPLTLSLNHNYNLLNAGWYVDKKAENTEGNPLANVISIYQDDLEQYPSNADSVALGMVTNSDGRLTFDPEYVRDAGLGNSLAPRGHYVFDINDFNRDTKRLNPEQDGSPPTTLTQLQVIDSSGQPTYNPDPPPGEPPTTPPGGPTEPVPPPGGEFP